MVYINELNISLKVQAQKTREAGEVAWVSDIADITEVDIGIEIPPDYGIFLLFSVGWRKGAFFDFLPLTPKAEPRDYRVGHALAACWCALMFQERFNVTEEQWEWILSQGWFLFIGMSDETLRQIILHSQERWDLERLSPQIIADARAVAALLPKLCTSSPFSASHHQALEIGARYFLAEDSFSAAHVLYPAVEGILRRHYAAQGEPHYPRQTRLIDAAKATASTGRHAYCLLMVDRFDVFLRNVIFADFDWRNPKGVSRHTIGHGVVEKSECDEVSVARVLFSIHQLIFSLHPPTDDGK